MQNLAKQFSGSHEPLKAHGPPLTPVKRVTVLPKPLDLLPYVVVDEKGSGENPDSAEAKKGEIEKADRGHVQLTRGILTGLKGAFTSKGMYHLSVRGAYGFTVSVNSVAAKYLQFLDGTNPKQWSSIVASMAEIANFDAIFDEVFVEKMVFNYQPLNKYSAQSTASTAATGSPGFVNTLGAVVTYLPNNSAAYTDSSATWYAMRASEHSHYVNLGDSFSFTAKNTVKFAWDGPLGDQSSGHTTQDWINIANISSAMGGLFQLATPEPSGAAAAIGTLLEGGIFGHVLVDVYLHFRARA